MLFEKRSCTATLCDVAGAFFGKYYYSLLSEFQDKYNQQCTRLPTHVSFLALPFNLVQSSCSIVSVWHYLQPIFPDQEEMENEKMVAPPIPRAKPRVNWADLQEDLEDEPPWTWS